MLNKEIKLKPCPFCGGEAQPLLGYILFLDENGYRIDDNEEGLIWFGACVKCPKCGYNIEKKKLSNEHHDVEWYDQIKQDAVDAWNRRSKDAE